MIGLLGSLTEAWTQVRISRVRVLLSLIGVAVAVAVMAGVIAFGRVVTQAQTEMIERYAGRPGTVQMFISPGASFQFGPGGGSVTREEASPQRPQPTREQVLQTIDKAMARFQVEYYSAVLDVYDIKAKVPRGLMPLQTKVVDLDYGPIHRLKLDEGRWFTPDDADRLAPAVIISHSLAKEIDAIDKTGPITLRLTGGVETKAVVVGITPPQEYEPPSLLLLRSSFDKVKVKQENQGGDTLLEVWLPPDKEAEGRQAIPEVIEAVTGKNSVMPVPSEGAFVENNHSQMMKIVSGLGVVVLALGALSLVNIAVVTVRARIHEIGIRRALGATSGRVFFSILLESVLATFVAGVVGVAVIIGTFRYIPFERLEVFVEDFPPFPVSAAVAGLAAATAVGALAGIIPAWIAVRVKPIDAIRY